MSSSHEGYYARAEDGGFLSLWLNLGLCVCQGAAFSLGSYNHLCIHEETAKTDAHSQRVGDLLWVAQVQFFDGTLLALTGLCCVSSASGGTSPYGVKVWYGRKLGLPSSSPPSCPLELSGLDCGFQL